jgi:L-glutamine-phosphate cytidylyltransferase
MKAIILAAGKGTRLGPYTENLPKGMLPFLGRTLIEHQVELYRQCGVEQIVLVCGYRADQCVVPGTVKYINERYEHTNMVESLMAARQELEGELLISYGDIVFEKKMLQSVMQSKQEIGVTVDTKWKSYWIARFGTSTIDTESLIIGPNGQLLEIGQPGPNPEKIHGRYVGLLKFSSQGIRTLLNVYDSAKEECQGKPWQTAKTFETGYMTDLLQEILDRGHSVFPILVEKGWLEFDTTGDYEKANEWAENGELRNFVDLPRVHS